MYVLVKEFHCLHILSKQNVSTTKSQFSLIPSVTGRQLAWQFLQEHFEELFTRYEGGFLLSRLVKVRTILTEINN